MLLQNIYLQEAILGISKRKDLIPENRKGRHYEYKDYIKIRQGITHLSKTYNKILIIPGTIAWKSEALSENVNISCLGNSTPGSPASVPSWKDRVHNLSKDEYIKEMQYIGEDYTGQEMKKWLSYTKEAPDSEFLKANDTLRASPFSDLIGGNGLSLQEKKNIIDDVLYPAVGFDYDNYIKELNDFKFGFAWNTVFFYLDGKNHAEYSKHSDYQEVIFTQELSIALPSKGESIINVCGLKIGIEICFDHCCDILKKYLLETSSTKPDIHLILSACVRNKGSQGNLLIHSSSKIDYNVPSLNEPTCFKGKVEIRKESNNGKILSQSGSPIHVKMQNVDENSPLVVKDNTAKQASCCGCTIL